MFLVYYISVSTVGTIATDWANDGVFGDGWYLGSGQEQFDEVTEEFEGAQESLMPLKPRLKKRISILLPRHSSKMLKPLV